MEMAIWKMLLFLFIFFLSHMVSPTTSQVEFADSLCSTTNGNYTANSTYQRNLQTLLPSLSINPHLITYGFYNLSTGLPPDKVNALVLCRGDVSSEICSRCVNASILNILQLCPSQKAAIAWYNQCMLRYSNTEIFGVMNNLDFQSIFNGKKASDPRGFLQGVKTLMDTLSEEAASGNSTRKFATGQISAGNETIYGLVQCTPDLSSKDCDTCISKQAMLISEASIGVRIFSASCILRYENYINFYTPPIPPTIATPSPSPPLLPSPTEGSNNLKSNRRTTIIIIVASIISTVILVIGISFILRTRKRKHQKKIEGGGALEEATDDIGSAETIQFDFVKIKVATNEFSDENKLGEGGFGAVYKGRLSSGQNIAVKRLSRDSGQGDAEFKNEVLVVAMLQHRNLVRLLGFCLEGTERLLIYEFLPNGSLDHFIFDHVKRTILSWERRYKIISGIARGLLYLHEDSRIRIIHRDLKVSNILLDGDMNPKIADFGMARLFELDETRGQTNRIVGTYGYMAPEYAYHGRFSIKSDVFSFGVLILEIMSGHKNNSFSNGEEAEDLLSFAWKNWRAGTPENVIDTVLRSGSRTEMIRCMHIGLLCVQENAADRPTMATVLLMLNSFSLTLSLPSQPAFFLHSNGNLSDSSPLSQNALLQPSQNGASISEFHPR